MRSEQDEITTFEQNRRSVLDSLAAGGMCRRSHSHACGRVAYGHSRNDCTRHAYGHAHDDANQHPCTDGVGHAHAGADFDPGADRHPNTYANSTPRTNRYPNTDAHSNRRTDGHTYTHLNANIHSRTEPNTGRRARHRLLPRQRGRG